MYGIFTLFARQSQLLLELEEIMKKFLGPFFALVLLLAVGAVAQRGGQQQHRGNGGHIPPPPPARTQGGPPERHTYQNGRVDERPHVSNDHWYGHDDRNDARFHLDHPFEHGRFTNFGPDHPFRFARFDLGLHRFWFNGGFGFEVFPGDWEFAADWCWTCPDDIVVYDDPDHPGWYLVYNTETGTYVHAQYIGQ
jgi:hypothetical protein